jgi:hypothetical protein
MLDTFFFAIGKSEDNKDFSSHKLNLELHNTLKTNAEIINVFYFKSFILHISRDCESKIRLKNIPFNVSLSSI